MKNSFLLIVVLFSLFFTAKAQPPCGFDDIHQKLLATDPAYARQVKETNISIRRFIDAHPGLRNPSSRTMALYTIPVVVHVMHTGGAIGTTYNPTDAQITGAINYLNQVYAGTYPGMTAPSAGGAAGNTDIQFALAQRTPTCGATNGIDRVDASSIPNYTAFGVNRSTSSGISDLTLKNFARWNAADYYNIWVVNKIDGADGTSGQFVAGYAYFAGAGPTQDGTVMLATQMITGAKTLPHEIGHALNLYHTFEGSNNDTQCPPYTPSPTCYSDGDLVCDTDPITNNFNVGTGLYNFSCRSAVTDNGCTFTPIKKYSINTESNFMSYTNCYTLFTNDQKARMQAAMSIPSRASLVSGTNMALVPCGTVINFMQSASSQAESVTGTTTGCRTYTDYTYQMVVGAALSATATATLSYTGTAVRGLDYDVTTNGNFASPSNVLTFLSGSTTAQSFTLRVYDDGNVEAAETAILDFTVSNGGGNGAKGTTSPTMTITLTDNDVIPAGTASGTYTIGTLSVGLTAAPFDAKQQGQKSQYLYKASELTAAGIAAGNITSFQLFVNTKLSTRPFTNFSIRMANTAVTYLVNGSFTAIPGMTAVYSSASYSTISGWNNFTLSTPFAWDGTSSLAIEICFDNTTADAANGADQMGGYSDGGSASQGNMMYQNGINCAGTLSSVGYYGNGNKPMIRLGISISGTAIETAAASTVTKHIAAGSNDYLYSNNGKLLMRLGSVSASLGCVTSSLNAGGTSWINCYTGQRSAKVFSVTPTTNIATTSYTIALYFDNTELGGKTAATLRIAKTSAATAGAANASNTVLVTPTVTTLGSGTTVFTANFTGFSRFFLVDAGVTLPIELTDFSARVNNEQNTVLNWITASEQNNRGFDVEASRDGLNFALLGTVASKGNSNAPQQYEYLHIKPQQGTTWYRLKQTDWDGRFTYSRIVFVNLDKGLVRSFVYPVPAKDRITINFGSMITKGQIDIFSVDMKVLQHENITGLSARKDINISSLPAGVYFLRFSDGTVNEITRFIKE
jgi:hypothetical protein